MTSGHQAPNLIVEIVVPHYLFSVLDCADDLGAAVYMHEEPKGPYVGFVNGIENDAGEWLIDITDLQGELVMRTHIENVERIVVS